MHSTLVLRGCSFLGSLTNMHVTCLLGLKNKKIVAYFALFCVAMTSAMITSAGPKLPNSFQHFGSKSIPCRLKKCWQCKVTDTLLHRLTHWANSH